MTDTATLEAAGSRGLSMKTFQQYVGHWTVKVFGKTIARNKLTRNYRFAEEAIELTQSLGMTREEWITLLDYVYGRPVGQPGQEVGGVSVTLAALVEANGLDMQFEAWNEFERCCRPEVIAKIRAKQANKLNPEAVLPALVEEGLLPGKEVAHG